MERAPVPQHRLDQQPDELPQHPDPFVDRLKRAGHYTAKGHFARAVTTLTDQAGDKYTSAVDNLDVMPGDEPGLVEVRLLSRRNEIIVVTAASVLAAAGVVYLQRNRSQRHKMSKRTSSHTGSRKPTGKLPH